MVLLIPTPFPQHIELLHSLGFKFIEKHRGWISYDQTIESLELILPKEVKLSLTQQLSFYDSLKRLKNKNPNDETLQAYQDPDFVIWQKMSLIESAENVAKASQEDQMRKYIFGKVKTDFFHPKLDLMIGGHGVSFNNNTNRYEVKGSFTTYHRETLESLFHELCHFIVMDSEKLKNKNFELKWSKNPKTFTGSLMELKVIALSEVLCQHYQVPVSSHEHLISSIADYPDSELFFKANMHLVEVFKTYTLDNDIHDDFALNSMIKEGLSKEEAAERVRLGRQDLLHRTHKVQVLNAFYDKKLKDKYTFEHVVYLFEQQIGNLK